MYLLKITVLFKKHSYLYPKSNPTLFLHKVLTTVRKLSYVNKNY